MSDERDPAEGAFAERVAHAYRATPPPAAEARERLDQAIASPGPARRRFAGSGRTLMFAAVLLVVGFVLGRSGGPPAPGPATPAPSPSAAGVPTDSGTRVVQFVLIAPRASQVSVVGDFNSWDPAATPMQRDGSATWTADVTVDPGRHGYAFVLDGTTWVSDPVAPLAPANEFGFRNSVLVVGEPAS